jgi:hypothetical protein
MFDVVWYGHKNYINEINEIKYVRMYHLIIGNIGL